MLKNLNDMLAFNWQSVVIMTIIMAFIRIIQIIILKKPIIFTKEIFNLIFIIYLSCLFEIVFFSQEIIPENYSINLIPFNEILRYEFGSYLFIKNIVGNIILFMPFGFFIGHFLKRKKMYLVFTMSLIASICIETIQLYIGRAFDLDDILLNVAGALIGYLFYKMLYRLNIKVIEVLRKKDILNIIIITILVILIMLVRFVGK